MEKRNLPGENINIDVDDFLAERPVVKGRPNPGGKKRRKRKRSKSRKMSLRKKRRLIISGLIGAVVFIICIICFSCRGGNEAENATVNSLYIGKDGKVTEAIVEDFKESYLDEEELKDFIKEQIDVFEKNNEGSKIKLENFEVEDGKAKVVLSYDSAVSYDEFNEVALFNGTIKECVDEWGLITDKEEVISVKDEKKTTLKALESDSDYKLLIVEEEQEIYLENEIKYASSNVTVASNGKMAKVDKVDVYTGFAYIVYK